MLLAVLQVAAVHAGESFKKPFCDVNGGVREAGQRKPLQQVTVTAISEDAKIRKTAITDEQGNYIFEGLRAGRYKLIFQKDGYKKVVREHILAEDNCGFELKVEMSRRESFQTIPGILLFGA